MSGLCVSPTLLGGLYVLAFRRCIQSALGHGRYRRHACVDANTGVTASHTEEPKKTKVQARVMRSYSQKERERREKKAHRNGHYAVFLVCTHSLAQEAHAEDGALLL